MFQQLYKPALTVLLSALVLAGCSSLPAAQTPAVAALPATWQEPTSGAVISQDWWRSFGSDELTGLITQAQTQSLDVAAAVARVQQAEASARIAGASLWPELTASVNASRSGLLGGKASLDAPAYSTGLGAKYEVDFWGRNRLQSDSARATLRASVFDHATVQLTVTASVASTWLQTVGLQQRADIAAGNLANAQRLLAVVSARQRAGAATLLDLAQQRGEVASLRRALAALQQQAQDSRITLGLLLGQATPARVPARVLAGLQVPTIGAGLPADLLTRRPDIARAEAQLAAAAANVGVARAAMLPSFVLNAGVGTGSERWSRWLENPFYSLAAGLTAPIFDAGRLASGRDLALAQQQELLAQYQAAIHAAAGDVETALNAVAGVDAQALAQAEELAQAQRAFTLAESRYRAGAETLLVLLVTQRSLYAAEDAAAQLQQAKLLAKVALFRALGGGWTNAAS
ncbi:efflux transporter outer membrane subunit [Variovorax sp. HJSM1_2]|uniref:efflux transporter outer membrane subunit n=1 Tax=Variovorax sp. HJSM1_2 TaxID=3366263 RepID=UPI003BF58B75